MSYTELQEKRGRLVTQAREALDEIKSNTDESRAGELTERHDKIMGEFDKIEALIEREARVEAAEKRAAEESRRAWRRASRAIKSARGIFRSRALHCGRAPLAIVESSRGLVIDYRINESIESIDVSRSSCGRSCRLPGLTAVGRTASQSQWV